jgi:hypothetical protein
MRRGLGVHAAMQKAAAHLEAVTQQRQAAAHRAKLTPEQRARQDEAEVALDLIDRLKAEGRLPAGLSDAEAYRQIRAAAAQQEAAAAARLTAEQEFLGFVHTARTNQAVGDSAAAWLREGGPDGLARFMASTSRRERFGWPWLLAPRRDGTSTGSSRGPVIASGPTPRRWWWSRRKQRPASRSRS